MLKFASDLVYAGDEDDEDLSISNSSIDDEDCFIVSPPPPLSSSSNLETTQDRLNQPQGPFSQQPLQPTQPLRPNVNQPPSYPAFPSPSIQLNVSQDDDYGSLPLPYSDLGSSNASSGFGSSNSVNHNIGSSFGNTASRGLSRGPSAFGSTNSSAPYYHSIPTRGNSEYDTASPFGSSNTGPGFEGATNSYSTRPSQFGGNNAPPFGGNNSSPFSGNNSSPFGGNNSSPFGNSKTTSGYGTVNQSSYNTNTSQDSEYGTLPNSSSPFGGNNSSPFGNSRTTSTFGTVNQSSNNTNASHDDPYAILPPQAPFGNNNRSVSNFGQQHSPIGVSNPPRPKRMRKSPKEKKTTFNLSNKEQKKSANTNILAVDLGKLADDADVVTGDPLFCKNCRALFNNKSVTESKEDDLFWSCEFCGEKQEIFIEDEEIPKSSSCDYVIDACNIKPTSDSAETTIIFVLDISGSMCVTSPIAGNHKLRGNTDKEWQSVLQQYQHNYHQPNSSVTYISRLQCVQAAIESQLKNLKMEHPNAKVGLVCFNSEVLIFGDGTQDITVVTGDKLHDYDALLEGGRKYQVQNEISVSHDPLVKKLFDLEERGATALGPAILVAIGMAEGSPGAKIVLATDGLANMGIGSLDTFGIAPDMAKQFYDKTATYALEKGVTVSVLGIKGEDINLATLGKLADVTSGDVDTVDPTKITDTFANILAAQLVATKVEVRVFLHKAFGFVTYDEDKDEEKSDSAMASKSVGNAFSDSEITFEYVLKSKDELKGILKKDEKSEDDNDEHSLPFQIQIEYTKMNGMRCIRAFTATKKITTNKIEAQKNINVGVVGMHANQQAAARCSRGDFYGAVQSNAGFGSLIRNNIRTPSQREVYGRWANHQNAFNNQMLQAHQSQQMHYAQQAPQSGFGQSSNQQPQQRRGSYRPDDATSAMISGFGHSRQARNFK